MSHCSASLSSACSPKYLGSVVKDANVIKQLLLLKMLFYTEPGREMGDLMQNQQCQTLMAKRFSMTVNKQTYFCEIILNFNELF